MVVLYENEKEETGYECTLQRHQRGKTIRDGKQYSQLAIIELHPITDSRMDPHLTPEVEAALGRTDIRVELRKDEFEAL